MARRLDCRSNSQTGIALGTALHRSPAPSLLQQKGVYYLFYAGAYNNAPQQIGVATSKDQG